MIKIFLLEELKKQQSPSPKFKVDTDTRARALLQDTIIFYNLDIKIDTLKPDINGYYSGFLTRDK